MLAGANEDAGPAATDVFSGEPAGPVIDPDDLTPEMLSDLSGSPPGKQIKNKIAASFNYFTIFNGGGSLTEQNDVRSFFESQSFTSLLKFESPIIFSKIS